MLQKIRDRISGWVSIVVIALVGGAFVLFGVQYYFQQGGPSDANTAAKVNGTIISAQELNKATTAMEKRMGAAVAGPMQAQLKAYALQTLITQTALVTTLQKENFRIALSQIKNYVMQVPEFQDNGHFSAQKFQMLLATVGETPEAFFQRAQSQFVVQQAMQGVGESAFILPSELDHFYALQHQSRAFGYFLLPMQSFSSMASVSDSDIKNYYVANPDKYKTPLKASFSYLLLSPLAIEKTVSVTEADAKAYYQSHSANFTLPSRYVVSQITIPVAQDATAAEVAKAKTAIEKIAHAIASHQKPNVGSATMTLSEAAIPPRLQTLLSGMKVGQTAEPLRTQNGFTLLTLQKKEPAETRSFESIKKQLVAMLKHQRVGEILTKESQTLTDLTYTNANSLQQASDALHLPVQTSVLMAHAGEKSGLFATPSVLNAVFSPSILESNNNSGLIPLPDGSQLVVRVLKKVPSQAVPLAIVHDQIKKTLVEQQATAKAGVLAYQLQKALLVGDEPEALAKKNHLVWHAVPLTSIAKKSSVPAMVLKTAFSAPLTTPQKNKLMAVQTTSVNVHDYAVVGVSQVQNANPSTMTAVEMKTERAKLLDLWSQLLQHSFISSVMQSSKIVIPKAT
ncbi:MAG: SurA N-terminal domain-containing protein [Coxiellaceae bacterium]|nr:SurA N-terminal domain-containing protein [Coxiellaceae bacterium]